MRVLLVKMSSLGDIVHTLPAVADAAERGARFDWVVEESYQPLAALVRGVDDVLPVGLRRWRRAPLACWQEIRGFHRRLRRRRYDLVLDAQGLIKSAAVGRWARGAERAGFDSSSIRERPAALAYRRRLRIPARAHAIDRARSLFAAALDYRLPATAPAFGLAKAEDRGNAAQNASVVLAHGSSWSSKLWPEAFWADVARRMVAAGLTPELPWLNGERARARRIAAAAPGARLWPPAALSEAIGRVAKARGVVGVDSGLGHLGAALGRPTVMVFGPTDASRTGCQGRLVRNLEAPFPCSPCLSRRCRYRGETPLWNGAPVAPACLAGVPPAEVWEALKGLMLRDGPLPAGRPFDERQPRPQQ